MSLEPEAAPAEEAAAGQEPDASAAPRRRRRFPPFHPLLVAAFPVLALFAHNLGAVPLNEIWRPLGLGIGGAAAVWLIAFGLFRSLRRSAIAATAVSAAFFSYGHAINVMPQAGRWLIMPLFGVTVVLVLFALWRSCGEPWELTGGLNLAAIVLVAPSCWSILQFSREWREALRSSNLGATGQVRAATRKALVPAPLDAPDVYYVILDAYGRADSLRAFYSFDNTPFVRALEQRGFYVAPLSHSNYDQTPLCLASAVNMRYLDDIAAAGGPGPNIETTRKLIDQNAVADFLKTRGYHYVYLWTGSGETLVESADMRLDIDSRVSDFEGQLLGLTAIDATERGHMGPYEEHRAYIRAAFKNLGEVAALPYHKFVFAHILAPHPPFVFKPNGDPVEPLGAYRGDDASWLLRRISRDQYKRGYIDQLQYVNRQVLAAVDAILNKSKRRPVIILQGDHGSRMNLDWDSLDRTDVREVFSILNAYLVPQKARRELYDRITPVNTFRVLLNSVFGASLPLLPDRSYYSTAHRPYDFQDVTREVPTKPLPPSLVEKSRAYDLSHPRWSPTVP